MEDLKLISVRCVRYEARKAGIIRRHRNGVHAGIKPLSCNKCEYTCATTHNLTVHIRNHTMVKPFPCTLCPYRASVASSIRRYMKN